MKKQFTEYEKSFRARWGESLTKQGFTQVSNAFLVHYSELGITTEEALFIIHVLRYKWTVEYPFPSFETIATQMGKSRGTVQGYARSLEEKGFLKRKFRKNQSSKIDFSKLIEMLTNSACQNLNKIPIEKSTTPYLNVDTKEDPVRIRIKEENNARIYRGMDSVGNILKER